MPVQMIELDEVQIVELSDEALEATVVVVGGLNACAVMPWPTC